jgi:hypothetical protein
MSFLYSMLRQAQPSGIRKEFEDPDVVKVGEFYFNRKTKKLHTNPNCAMRKNSKSKTTVKTGNSNPMQKHKKCKRCYKE